MRFGSLFSGIGGIDLGLKRAGMECAWQVEINPFCRKVLAKHWPDVKRYKDIKEVTTLAPVELIAGGFPCPVVSSAARGRNVGEWLWPQFLRIIQAVKPRLVLIENVSGLRRLRLGEILRDLALEGYDAEYADFPASAIGAPHRRSRVWVVAHTHSYSQSDMCLNAEAAQILPEPCETFWTWPDPPGDLRMDDGIPNRVDRLRALGNAVVPQVAEWIGRRIMQTAKMS